ncbi:lipase family alpha/beta hydrolase [Streptomyces sp. NPDC059009]|uniref:lipase family alpha/beta hydrolase n=1 Tax=Streptomyces sp. NPDC059009 TaxID=3346694 RepID=UPI00367F7189
MTACVLAVAWAGGAGAADGRTVADPVSEAKKLATPFLPGANDWSCKPGAKHPRPLVLVHGTLSLREEFLLTAPLYKKAGYCLFALDYGREPLTGLLIGGTGPMTESARQLATFVDGVLAATGTRQVDIVGYSQGGVLPRQYMKFEGGARKVHTFVGISPPNHGGRVELLDALLDEQPWLKAMFKGFFDPLNKFGDKLPVPCRACTDQLAGSGFMHRLNQGGDTVPGVSYTVIVSKRDAFLGRYQDHFLKGPNVHNIVLSDICPLRFPGHLAMMHDAVAARLALNALDPAHAVKPSC